MPAKKKQAVKKPALKSAKPIKKKTVSKKSESSKTIAKKKSPRPEQPQAIVAAPIKIPAKPPIDVEVPTGPMKDCDHCDATGKCAAGQPYDRGYHQMFGSKIRLTSCIECLEAAGEHHNSKKMVACSFCRGTGKVPE